MKICFMTLAVLLAFCSGGCTFLFFGKDDVQSHDSMGGVSAIRQQEIRYSKTFVCLLPPQTPDAVRILLLRTGSRMHLTPVIREADPGCFPAYLRSGRADAVYSIIREAEAERLCLHRIPLPVGGALLIRPDDPAWESLLMSSIPME